MRAGVGLAGGALAPVDGWRVSRQGGRLHFWFGVVGRAALPGWGRLLAAVVLMRMFLLVVLVVCSPDLVPRSVGVLTALKGARTL